MIVLVSGAPATGKSTLARLLGDTLSWPVLHRDDVKSGLSTVGTPAVAIAAFDLWFDLISVLASAGSHVIGEAAMHNGPSTPSVRRLTEIGDVRVVHCSSPDFVERYLARPPRHPVHDDAGHGELMQSPTFDFSVYDAIRLDGVPLLDVLTTNGYRPDLDEIVRFCQA